MAVDCPVFLALSVSAGDSFVDSSISFDDAHQEIPRSVSYRLQSELGRVGDREYFARDSRGPAAPC